MGNDIKTVGVAGLGIMGSAMARNLIKAGYKVVAYNRTRKKAEESAKDGARIAQSPRELSRESDAVIVMVKDPKAVEELLSGPDGILAVPGNRKPLIQMSTLDIESTRKFAGLAETAGYRFLDCPVTGSKKQVEAAQLILEAGGDSNLLDEIRPVLMAVGSHIVHAGKVGNGTALKLCMNLIVAQMTTALCEAVQLARKTGIDPSHIFEVLKNSAALDCLYYQIKKEPLLSGDFPPAFSLSNMLKDVRFMNQEAAKRGLKLPVNEAVQALMEKAVEAGMGEEDLTCMSKVI